jgi:transcriptional regulator with XRE-family HTH domain
LNNLTFAELARQAGIRRSLLTELKSGRTKGLSLSTARKIAMALNISLDEFR